MTIRYIKVSKFVEKTGYTDKAVRRKIQEGVWLEGQEYLRAPDGSILINEEGYHKWAENKQKAA